MSKRETHELEGKIQPLISFNTYRSACADKPKWPGGRAELTLADAKDATVTVEATDVESLREALALALEMLNDTIACSKAEWEDYANNAIACHVCGAYYDKRVLIFEHADGRGRTCLGDGNVFLTKQRIAVEESDGVWGTVEFEDLKKGQRFKVIHSWDSIDTVYTAVSDAYRHFFEQRQPPHADWVVKIPRAETDWDDGSHAEEEVRKENE